MGNAKMGPLLACFALPVTEDGQRKQANALRKYLLVGRSHLKIPQCSAYVRHGVPFARQDTRICRIRQARPPDGSIPPLLHCPLPMA